MTSEEFRKYAFRSTTVIEYTYPEWNVVYLCNLCEVDFWEEILTLQKFDSLRDDRIQVNIKYCTIHNKKVKPILKKIL